MEEDDFHFGADLNHSNDTSEMSTPLPKEREKEDIL